MHNAITIDQTQATTVEAAYDPVIELGQWYWVRDSKDTDEDLECVSRFGSNFVEVTNINGHTQRIHVDEFQARSRLEPNASQVIQSNVKLQKEEVARLLAEVVAITARLGVGTSTASLSAGSEEGQALARLDPKVNVSDHKAALVLAKEKELPELFKAIESANQNLVTWLKAETLPMKAQLTQMRDVLGHIDDRIFNIELYAGLTEKVERIADGAPAAMTEKVRLMQRRCYMDEECLARYEVGGMEFSDLNKFDAWLARPENRDRILPFPRCIVVFQVRRYNKEREVPKSFIEFFSMIDDMAADKLTFMYIRNGDILHRMNTALEFGEQLFPDTKHNTLIAGTKLWAKIFVSHVQSIITDAQYQGLCEEYEAKKAEYAITAKAHPEKLRAWKQAKLAAKKSGEKFRESEPHLWPFWDQHPRTQYESFEPDNIYYDDIKKKIAEEVQQSNRIAIIIQGLLDRSVVLHPHPPWKIWSEGGFNQALELIHDDSRALVGGARPDFEIYRKRLNASLAIGSITVGQRPLWHEKDRQKYANGQRRYHDPGPGVLARVVEFRRTKGVVGYAWYRKGESWQTAGKQFRSKFSCDVAQVLNVDAYKPGDFRIFFSDPRTRADYVQWAPLLLEAEEFHAGNRKVAEPPPPTEKASSLEGRRAYQRRRDRLRLIGKTVRLAEDITTTKGDTYKKGSLWFVRHMAKGGLTISEVKPNGKMGVFINSMQPNDLLVVDTTIEDEDEE